MTLKEVLETKVKGLVVAVNWPNGEIVYELVTDDQLAYPPVGARVIKQVRPDLLEGGC